MSETLATLAKRYRDSAMERRLKNYALWTIPSVYPKVDTTSLSKNEDVEHDYQSMGAMLVNNLAAKLATTLFPPDQSFFRIKPSAELAGLVGGAKDIAKLSELETQACKRLFLNASYAQLIQAMRLLIITGNALVFRHDSKMVVYSTRNYAVLRDNMGTILDVILWENLAYGSIPQDIKRDIDGSTKKEFDQVVLYTRIKYGQMREGQPCVIVSYEVDGKPVGKQVTIHEKRNPYIVVTWNLINGDSYGRGHVEDNAGDLAKLSDLSYALTMYEIESCKVVNLVKPGATIDLDSLDKAEHGKFVLGDPDAIRAHETGAFGKIQQMNESINQVYSRLATAFMYSANMRQAERVTAEEIKQNIIEADRTFGSARSNISQSLLIQLGYLLTEEENPSFMAAVIGNGFSLDILTGLQALGRSTELTNFMQAVQELQAFIPTLEQLSARFDKEKIVDKWLRDRGISLDEYMMSEEELKKQQAAAQNAQVQQSADPLNQINAMQEVLQ